MSSRPFTEVEFVAFDLENDQRFRRCPTESSNSALVRFRGDGTELGRMERLVNPGRAIPFAAGRIHGIADEAVRDCPAVDEVLPDFIGFLGAQSTVLVAHNAAFDLGFLAAALARAEISPPKHSVIDSLGLARRKLRSALGYSLPAVAAALGLDAADGHRAVADALMVKEVLLRLQRRPPQLATVSDLFNLAPPLQFESRQSDSPEPLGIVESLRSAIREGSSIRMVCNVGTKGIEELTVTPRELLRSSSVSYLVAYCHIDGIDKHYRLDRIRELRREEA